MNRRDFLETAAAVAAVAAGDVPDIEAGRQQERLLALADRDEDDRWMYNTERNLAHVRSGLVNAELDALCDQPSGRVETFASREDTIPLGFEVSTDGDESVGTLVHLSAEQAEGLAVDLLEQVHAVRGDE